MKFSTLPRRALRQLMIATALIAPLHTVLARTPDANALFTWAEKTYGSFFPGQPANETFPPYVYRRYDNGNYLAITDEKLYLLGPLTAGVLQPLGSITQFSCFVYPGECDQAPVGAVGTELSEVKSFLDSYDALWANAVPASGTVAASMTDACYLNNGYTRETSITSADSDLALWKSREAYRVGAKRTNATVLAIRSSTNADGSTRREIDIQYDLGYVDGTTDSAVLKTLISGSSHGSCNTPQFSNSLRWFGNRQQASFSVWGRNIAYRNYKLTDGSLSSTQARREVAFYVRDPAGIATYAIVSGAGPNGTVGGVVTSFSLKLLSPRVMRDESAMAGKTGNFTNWANDDTFRTCRTATSSAPNAALADCAGVGASSYSYGLTLTGKSTMTQAELIAADNGFNAMGFGGRYTVSFYNDDGWKTVNGQAGKTPVASYTADLAQLPFSFVSMAVGSDATGRYPLVTTMSPDNAALASSYAAGTASSLNLQWNAPVTSDGTAYRLSEIADYYQGPLSSNSSTATYPAQRLYTPIYPSPSAVQTTLPISAKPSAVRAKTYNEFDIWYSNRNGNRIGLIHTYQ